MHLTFTGMRQSDAQILNDLFKEKKLLLELDFEIKHRKQFLSSLDLKVKRRLRASTRKKVNDLKCKADLRNLIYDENKD